MIHDNKEVLEEIKVQHGIVVVMVDHQEQIQIKLKLGMEQVGQKQMS